MYTIKTLPNLLSAIVPTCTTTYIISIIALILNTRLDRCVLYIYIYISKDGIKHNI